MLFLEVLMFFKDREHAAYQLLDKLKKYDGQNVIVAGIPRGAMPMALIIADGLNADLGAILVHKIPHPDSPEFAIGSIGISGNIHKSQSVELEHIQDSYIQSESKKQLAVLKERQKKYGLEKLDMKGRAVIIVDDGIATGETTISAIEEVKLLGATKIILATAVASTAAARKVKSLVDEFIALDVPEGFHSVGQFFLSFPQVTDEEVVKMLAKKRLLLN
jgi:putative phosphoribosyl transferase